VRCQTLVVDPGPRSLTGSCESLLLECARLHDEAQTLGRTRADGFTELALEEPPPDAVPTTPHPAPRPYASPPPPTVPPPPRTEPVTSSSIRRAPPTFEDLFEQAVECSLAKRHGDALELFRQAALLRPEDLKVKVNIARLEKLLRGPEDP